MNRIVKNYEERRNEILDAAESLFYSKGFEACTVNDILKTVGIAKGTFYHYFPSKEAAMDGVIARNVDKIIDRVQATIEKAAGDPNEKLMNAFLAMRVDDPAAHHMLEDMHQPANALLHQKSLKQLIQSLSPILADVVQEGIDQKIWRCSHPLQCMQIFLAAALSLTDEGIFEMDADSQTLIMIALIGTLEKMLGVPENEFLKQYSAHWATE
ncbi:TetR/AcrR family transcriptional regulator [Anoxynatronum buryatiense]|uniref:Transcriptional regulator, TetR family n=1 Tax=Anoxynatronum buryatiense TaxID=489973 RepID=A0AA46AJQ2_9CLOT|nr:TetR/AcrR family transcriptional regulator [Anoxynatronum buryatiense]SMP63370.1 transcriptional regulator, TetR family [Anoxynatronum buryatiense]